MIENNEYEILKASFIDSQRLFNKLANVSDNIINIVYDESGLYQEEEEMYERHWKTLTSKIVDALSESLHGYDIELLKNKTLEIKELRLNLVKDEVKSKISVNYSELDSLSIIQIS